MEVDMNVKNAKKRDKTRKKREKNASSTEMEVDDCVY